VEKDEFDLESTSILKKGLGLARLLRAKSRNLQSSGPLQSGISNVTEFMRTDCACKLDLADSGD
jgi:hypothetical protein